MDQQTREKLLEWEQKYNDPVYFEEDPIAFPRHFAPAVARAQTPEEREEALKDCETAALFAAHFAWGRRSMIVRDTTRLMEWMEWHPLKYVLAGDYRDDRTSIHRTVMWSDIAGICARLREFYASHGSLEELSVSQIRTRIFGQKDDPNAANKKICMMRRWMVRRDAKVDLGLWTSTSPASLVVPLDVHVYTQATGLGLTSRSSRDLKTAIEITDAFREIWPDDPLRGDFALFGYGVSLSDHNR